MNHINADSKSTAVSEGSYRLFLFIVAAQVVTTIFVLRWLGQGFWCECGRAVMWISSASSAHTSQHLFDPYSFTHIAHGFVFCGLFAMVGPRTRISHRFLMAIAIECLWEIFENTPFVINRYRTATAALGYEGDSIANAVSDIVACGAGFLFATKFGWRITLPVFAATEVLLLATIRDSLVLNVIMLCFPIDAIRQWQLG